MGRYIRKFPGSTEFLAELRRESDRGAALIVASLLDERLHAVLRVFFVNAKKPVQDLLDTPNAPPGTFSARIAATYAMGLIEDIEYHDLNQMRKIRNKFAHQWKGLSFQDGPIADLCRALSWHESPDPNRESNPRIRFDYASIRLFRELLGRELLVSQERRVVREWPSWDESTSTFV